MTIDFDKSQFPQIEASAPCATPAFFGMAMEAQIADSDFRTYVLLCQLAWQEHPAAASPWTERTYAELAALHPEHRPVSAETVRGRLNRLTRAGLITRERSGQSVWRTYPVLDGPLFPGLGTVGPPQVETQPSVQAPIHLTLHLTLDPEQGAVQVAGGRRQVADGSDRVRDTHPQGSGRVRDAHPERSDRVHCTHPQPQMTGGQRVEEAACVSGTHPDSSGRVQGTHPEVQGAEGQVTGWSDRVLDIHPERSGRARGTHTESGSTGAQMPEAAGRVLETHPDRSDCVQGTHPEQSAPAGSVSDGADNPLGVYGEHTQTTLTPSGCAPGTHPDAPHTRVRARVSTDFSTDLSTDSLSINSIQEKESDQSVLSTDQRKGQVPIKNAGVGEKHTQTPTSPQERVKPAPATPSPAKDETGAPAPTSPDMGQPPSDEKSAAAKPSHPVLDYLNVLPAHEALAVTLATLAPQGMNYEGIRECLKQPRLTRAWLDYVLAQGDAIRSPAAYIRQGVRSAKPPIGAVKTDTEAGEAANPGRKPRRDGWNPNAFGWDDPTIPDSLYKKYSFDNGRLAAARRAALEAGEMSH